MSIYLSTSLIPRTPYPNSRSADSTYEQGPNNASLAMGGADIVSFCPLLSDRSIYSIRRVGVLHCSLSVRLSLTVALRCYVFNFRNHVIKSLGVLEEMSETITTMVPIQVLADIDNSRNPMQLTKDRLERAATENQFMNGKIQAIDVSAFFAACPWRRIPCCVFGCNTADQAICAVVPEDARRGTGAEFPGAGGTSHGHFSADGGGHTRREDGGRRDGRAKRPR